MPVKRQVAGAELSFSLEKEVQTVRAELAAVPARVARTLVKEGSLRVTVVGVNPGGSLRSHRADGPITIQVMDGEIEIETDGHTRPLSRGMLFALNAGITHSVRSARGGIFLLTVIGAADEHRAPR